MAKVKNQKQKERGVFPGLLDFWDAISWIALLFHDSLAGAIAGLGIVLLIARLFGEEKKIPFMLSSIAISIAVGLLLKPLFSQIRPCEFEPSTIPCPQDFAMPSSHSLAAFSLVFSSAGNRSFPAYLAFALLIAYSRLHLGVHSLEQVAAGAALALFAHFLTETAWKSAGWRIPEQVRLRSQHKTSAKNRWEDARQAVHFSACAALVIFAFAFGTEAAFYLVSALFFAGILLSHFALSGTSIPVASQMLSWLEREDGKAGFGALSLAAGCLAILAVLPSLSQAAAAIWILGAGDSASTFFGRRGKIPLFYNKKKTAEGTAAFFLACLPAALLAGWEALAVSAAAAFLESLQADADDNLSVSVCCLVGLEMLGGH
ncbi:MAG: phosphatase PAP2 family protein [Candidatus Micrarchaeota archaeon]|nr:phosphatase PAP2 family protein [Candidatus Micrarchaeota archaeon]